MDKGDSTLVYYDPARAEQRGMHALVVGISEYPNLPPHGTKLPPGDESESTLGLSRLDSAAPGATRVASWLIEHGAQFTPPLVSVRLLLTPSPAEKLAFNVIHPTLDNLIEAAVSWRKMAAVHPDNVTMFYFAGHGVQRAIGDHVLLLHDFGHKRRPLLASAIEATELMDGMRISEDRRKIGRRQLYFFDACKIQPERFKKHENLKASPFWDKDLIDADDRSYTVFYTTAPGHAAYGNVGGHSLFCEALLKCLNGGAAVADAIYRANAPPIWRITAASLRTALENHLSAVSANAGATQTLQSTAIGDFPFFTWKTTPKVEIEINVDPGAAKERIGLTFLSGARALVTEIRPPIRNNPHTFPIAAGSYICQGTDKGAPPPCFSDLEEFINHVTPLQKTFAVEFLKVT